MNCPRCTDAALSPVAVDRSTRVDWCARCGGAWYDKGELQRVLPELEGQDPVRGGAGARPGLRCPSCATAMIEVRFPALSTVRVDACPGCQGCWLDKGELVALRDHIAIEKKLHGARAGAGEAGHIPLALAREVGRRLQWRWVAAGALLMLACTFFIYGGLLFFDFIDRVGDRRGRSDFSMALWATLLGFPVGGFVIGRSSAGFTVWEAGLAALPSVLVLGLGTAAPHPVQAALLLPAAFVLAVLGAAVGERSSGG